MLPTNDAYTLFELPKRKRAADDVWMLIPSAAPSGLIVLVNKRNMKITKFIADRIDIAFNRPEKLPSDGK